MNVMLSLPKHFHRFVGLVVNYRRGRDASALLSMTFYLLILHSSFPILH